MRMAVVVLVLLFSANFTFSFYSKFLSLDTNSSEYRMIVNPDAYSLKEGALLASGVAPEFLGGYLAQISNFEEQVRPQVSNKNKIETAYILFQEMHRKLLKQYNAPSTTLDVLLKTGKYNCLSSSVLYCVLLEDFGIPYQAAVLPTHVFTILDDNGSEIDVENTTPYGFNIGTNRDAQEIFRKQTGFEYSTDRKIRETVGKKGLIAYTYGNIAGYTVVQQGPALSIFQNAAKSVAVYDGAWYLYTNVVAGYSIYSYYLITEKKNYELALNICEEALLNYPMKDIIVSNYYATLDLYLDELINRGRYEQSFNVYERSKKLIGAHRVIEDNLYSRILYRTIGQELDMEKAYKYAEKAVKEIPGSKEIRGHLVYGLSQIAKKLARDWENYPNGEAFFLKWFALLDDPDFYTIYEDYYTEVSVRFYKQGMHDKAIEICRKALVKYPDSAVLKKNVFYIAAETAVALLKKNDTGKGLKYLKIAYGYNPKDEALLSNFKYTYELLANDLIEQKEYAKALTVINEGLAYVPDDKALLHDRDYCLKKLKK